MVILNQLIRFFWLQVLQTFGKSYKKVSMLTIYRQLTLKSFETIWQNLARNVNNGFYEGKKEKVASDRWGLNGDVSFMKLHMSTTQYLQHLLLPLQYITFSPGHIILADLCFLRPISSLKRTAVSSSKKTVTALILLDAFSRFLQIRVLNGQTASVTYENFREALPAFGDHNYKHLLTDKVGKVFEK